MNNQVILSNQSRLFKRKDAATYLHISVRLLADLTSKGCLTPVKLTKRCVRYRIDDLDAYIASCRDERKVG